MPALNKRDDDSILWDSDTGLVVRYVILIAIVVIVFGYIFGGYLHARSRIRRGLPPMGYHRCLITQRRTTYRQQPLYNVWVSQPIPIDEHGNHINHDVPPPPVYDPTRPPVYEPPAGATKIDPSQPRNEQLRASGSGPAAYVHEVPAYEPPQGGSAPAPR